MPEVTKVTKTNTAVEVKAANEVAVDEYISYCALGGILTDDDGTTSKMSVDQFCQIYGVTRMTLSRWKRQTSDWGDRVSQRRDEIMPAARVTHVWNSMYLIARQTKDKRSAVEAGKLILGHNGLKLPKQPIEHDVGEGLADLLQMGRAKFTKDADSIQEGTVIDAEPS